MTPDSASQPLPSHHIGPQPGQTARDHAPPEHHLAIPSPDSTSHCPGWAEPYLIPHYRHHTVPRNAVTFLRHSVTTLRNTSTALRNTATALGNTSTALYNTATELYCTAPEQDFTLPPQHANTQYRSNTLLHLDSTRRGNAAAVPNATEPSTGRAILYLHTTSQDHTSTALRITITPLYATIPRPCSSSPYRNLAQLYRNLTLPYPAVTTPNHTLP